MNIDELLKASRGNLNIYDSFAKANVIINQPEYNKIMCSISGGSDSDIMLDLLHKVDDEKKIQYVWFDTGIEYQATKDHLKYLEDKYKIEIHREKAIKPIPLSCKQLGQPFLSKYVSENMGRLQKNNFKWEDKPFEELVAEYPNCISALSWWCNKYKKDFMKTPSMFDIDRNKYLKQFIIANPPAFSISNKCCTYAKKNVAHKFIKENKIDLDIVGVRRAEGGIRSATKTCFDRHDDKADKFRPIFWFTNQDKIEYEQLFGVTHSKCYTKYGMARTGCAGCPFNRKYEDEKQIIEWYEPKLYKAINNIFKEAYEYTRQYKEFCRVMENKAYEDDGQTTIFDYL